MIKNNTTGWSISSDLIIGAAMELWYSSHEIVRKKNLFSLSDWGKNILFKNIDCGLNSALGFKISEDKELTYLLIGEQGLPVPKSKYVNQDGLLSITLESIGMKFPLVVKPIDGAHGDGVSIDIMDDDALKNALNIAFWHGTRAIVQNHVNGFDHRVLVVGDRVVAVAMRDPASVIGDGIHTIRELVDIENQNPLRWAWDHSAQMSPILFDEESIALLKKNELTVDVIPEEWKKIYVRWNANLSTWGKSIDLTDVIHPSIKDIAVRAAKIVWLQVAWVDILATDISKPLSETGWVIIEINATPWLRMHHFPSEWSSRNVAMDIVILAFQKNQ